MKVLRFYDCLYNYNKLGITITVFFENKTYNNNNKNKRILLLINKIIK